MSQSAFMACGPGVFLRHKPGIVKPCRQGLPNRVVPAVAVPIMVMPGKSAAPSSTPPKESGIPVRAPGSLAVFRDFFHAMTGSWNSERTYHYTQQGRRESSQTTFDVTRLSNAEVDGVLESNNETAIFTPQEQAYSEGFNVSFLTRMETETDLVRSSTNLAFVPRNVMDDTVEGDYYRDLGYEESAPVAATFTFDSRKRELNMMTYYSKVVSVDQITLVNSNVRLRKIVNYVRPKSKIDPLVEPLLVGFGVESKGESRRLVE